MTHSLSRSAAQPLVDSHPLLLDLNLFGSKNHVGTRAPAISKPTQASSNQRSASACDSPAPRTWAPTPSVATAERTRTSIGTSSERYSELCCSSVSCGHSCGWECNFSFSCCAVLVALENANLSASASASSGRDFADCNAAQHARVFSFRPASSSIARQARAAAATTALSASEWRGEERGQAATIRSFSPHSNEQTLFTSLGGGGHRCDSSTTPDSRQRRARLSIHPLPLGSICEPHADAAAFAHSNSRLCADFTRANPRASHRSVLRVAVR